MTIYFVGHKLWGLLYALYAQTHLNHDSNRTPPNITIPPICGISKWKNCSVLTLTFNNTLTEFIFIVAN